MGDACNLLIDLRQGLDELGICFEWAVYDVCRYGQWRSRFVERGAMSSGGL